MSNVALEKGQPVLRTRPGERTIATIEVTPWTIDWLLTLVPDNDGFHDELLALREACRDALWDQERERG